MKTHILIGTLAAASLSFTAHAALLDFDDSSLSSGSTLTTYGGLDWTNIRVLDPSTSTSYKNSGFENGLKSAPKVAFNFGGAPGSVGSANGFLLNSGYFTSASYTGLTLEFVGSAKGSKQFEKRVTLDVQQPLFVTFDWTIDLLQMSTSCPNNDCTVPSDVTPFGFQFVMDNLQIGDSTNPVPVPEPGALALLGAGLLGMRLMRGRRNAAVS